MSVKGFFKSNAFKSLAVLMIIVIVCGGLIAICNGLFYVSDEEATARAVAKIFGKTPDSMTQLTLTAEETQNAHGKVGQAYYIEDGGANCLLVYSTGGSGYKGGTVSVWTVVTVESADISDGRYISGTVTGISSVKYDGDTNQTLMSNFKSTHYAQFTLNNDNVARGIYFTASALNGQTSISGDGTVFTPPAGVSLSSIAIVNAVNAALCFAYGGGNE